MTKIFKIPTEYLKNLPDINLSDSVIDVSEDKKDYIVPKHSGHLFDYKEEVSPAKKWFNNEMESLVNRFLEKFPEYFAEYKKQNLAINLYSHGDYTEENITYRECSMDAFFGGKISINTRSQDTPEDHFYNQIINTNPDNV